MSKVTFMVKGLPFNAGVPQRFVVLTGKLKSRPVATCVGMGKAFDFVARDGKIYTEPDTCWLFDSLESAKESAENLTAQAARLAAK